MGEYAMYGNREIKIGTCEEMYYLRWDQRHAVTHKSGNVNVLDAEELKVIRFRFPWPDEDDKQPGDFEDYSRAVAVEGIKAPADAKHYNVQFRSDAGYLCSLPCPEGSGPHPVNVVRNGFRGAVLLYQQALRNGALVPVFRCGGCGTPWRSEDPAELSEVFEYLKAEAKHRGMTEEPNFYSEITRRIMEGFTVNV